MIRRVVVAYLVFSGLIGPGLCCCTPLQLLSCSHRQPTSLVTSQDTKPDTRPSGCCCKHQHQTESHTQTIPPCPEEKNAPACPCRHREHIPVALIGYGEGASMQLMFTPDEFAKEIAVLPLGTDDNLAADLWPSFESLSSPFQTAIGILRALQTMRC